MEINNTDPRPPMCQHCLDVVEYNEDMSINYKWYHKHVESRRHAWWWKVRRRWIKFVYS